MFATIRILVNIDTIGILAEIKTFANVGQLYMDVKKSLALWILNQRSYTKMKYLKLYKLNCETVSGNEGKISLLHTIANLHIIALAVNNLAIFGWIWEKEKENAGR